MKYSPDSGLLSKISHAIHRWPLTIVASVGFIAAGTAVKVSELMQSEKADGTVEYIIPELTEATIQESAEHMQHCLAAHPNSTSEVEQEAQFWLRRLMFINQHMTADQKINWDAKFKELEKKLNSIVNQCKQQNSDIKIAESSSVSI